MSTYGTISNSRWNDILSNYTSSTAHWGTTAVSPLSGVTYASTTGLTQAWTYAASTIRYNTADSATRGDPDLWEKLIGVRYGVPAPVAERPVPEPEREIDTSALEEFLNGIEVRED